MATVSRFLIEGRWPMNDVTAAILANETLTPAEVQRILRASRSSIYRGISKGSIPSFRIDSNVRIPSAWLRALLLTTIAA
jgi:predicted DNA-binding transcriptional regulator AlpA